MKLSIIIPVYNAEKYICRCLDSIYHQDISPSDYETILIDDGSTDRTATILAKYASKYSNIHIITQKNSGASAARNTGIKQAHGDFITFIDADDYIEQTYLYQLLSASDINQKQLVCAGYQTFGAYKDGMKVPHTVTYHKNDVDKSEFCKYLGHGYLVRAMGWKLFRRDIIINNNIQFNKNLHFCEDTPFVFNYLSKCDSIRLIPCDGYRYYKPVEQHSYKITNCTTYKNHITEIKASIDHLSKSWSINLSHIEELITNMLYYNYSYHLGQLAYTDYKKELQLFKKYSLEIPFPIEKKLTYFLKWYTRKLSLIFPFLSYPIDNLLIRLRSK